MLCKGEVRFARRAIRKGTVTGKQMLECIELLQRLQTKATLMDILVEKGYADKLAIREIAKEVEKQQSRSWLGSHDTLGGYEILAQIGEGAMGTVFKAQKGGKTAAIKVMDRELAEDQEFIARFLREARNAARLRHRNIVEAYDFGEQDGDYYFVMEFVDGRSLAEILYSRGKIEERLALTITKQVAEALHQAHQFSIIHRDIKPENIMISNSGVVKLCDLGLSLDLSEDVWKSSGIAIGTVYYSSPEQVAGNRNLDIRSDIYSLGISLYHMLTGTLPFDDNDTRRVANRQINEKLPSIDEKVAAISPKTRKLLDKMTAKAPGQRYQSPQKLLADIWRILRGREEKVDLSKTESKPKRRETDKLVLKKKSGQIVPWWIFVVAAAGIALGTVLGTIMR